METELALQNKHLIKQSHPIIKYQKYTTLPKVIFTEIKAKVRIVLGKNLGPLPFRIRIHKILNAKVQKYI